MSVVDNRLNISQNHSLKALTQVNEKPPVIQKDHQSLDKDLSSEKSEFSKKLYLLGVNFVISSFLSGALLYTTKPEDTMTKRLGIQDIITNLGIMAGTVFDPKGTAKQLEETVKETTAFTAIVSLIQPYIAENFGIVPGTLVGPLGAEAIAAYRKRFVPPLPKESISAEEEQSRNIDVRKTHMAVGLAGVMKAKSLANHLNAKRNNATISISAGTLLNTLKTSVTTELDYHKGERIRPSRVTTPIFFDGAVSQIVAERIDKIAKEKGWSQTKPAIIMQSLAGGLISVAGLYGVKFGLDKIFDTFMAHRQFDKSKDSTEALRYES